MKHAYDTESLIGEAIARSSIARRDFFITPKVADTNLTRHDSSQPVRGILNAS